MRKILNLGAAYVVLTMVFAASAALEGSGHELKPKLGGVVVETKAGDMEIVAKPESIQIYITDHGKAVKLDGATAKVTLLNRTEKSEVHLAAAGDKLEAKDAYEVAIGTRGITFVTLAGKSGVTASYEVK